MPPTTWPPSRLLLVAALVPLCWLLMLVTHELGHVLQASVSGGRVSRVVLDPRTISRTDVAPNPHPLWVAWGGAVWGSLLPLGLWAAAELATSRLAYLARFFAGFALVANGAYLLGGAVTGVGDAGEMLRHGAPAGVVTLFGLLLTAAGLTIWHGLARAFEATPPPLERRLAWTLWVALLLLALLLGLVFPA